MAEVIQYGGLRNTSRPILQQGIDVRANADDMGAAVGRGMMQLARGIQDAGDAFAQVQALEDEAAAKEADNSYARWARERQYGDGGYMTLEGKAAVEGRAAFEKEAAEKRDEFGKDLRPGAARLYKKASQARLDNLYEQSIVHTANERKKWVTGASASRLDTFTEDAVASFSNPKMVDKSITAGVAEITSMGELNGWDADTVKNRQAEYISGVRKNVTLRLAQDDPLAAEAYYQKHKGQLTGPHQYDLDVALKDGIVEEKGKRLADRVLNGGGEAKTEAPGAGLSAGKAASKRKDDRAAIIRDAARELGISPVDLATVISYETGGTFSTKIRGGKNNRYIGLIQFGDEEQRAYGANQGQSFGEQMQAVVRYLKHRGLKPGMGILDLYSTINAGSPGHAGRSDRPGYTVGRHVQEMSRSRHRKNAEALLGGADIGGKDEGADVGDYIERQLNAEPNEDVREYARKRLGAHFNAQDKARDEQVKAAKAQLWAIIEQGGTPDQVPSEIRRAVGMEAMNSAWSYVEKTAKRGEVESDESLLYQLRLDAANDPQEFSRRDLNDYRDRLSPNDIRELTTKQTDFISDRVKASSDSVTMKEAFSASEDRLEAMGITLVGKTGAEREEAARRKAMFQNALAMQIEEFKKMHSKQPNTMEVDAMINRLLLPVAFKRPNQFSDWAMSFDPMAPFQSSVDAGSGFLFEADARADGTSVDIVVKYEDIPSSMRSGIRRDLELELGRAVSNDEVVDRYELYRLAPSELVGSDVGPFTEGKRDSEALGTVSASGGVSSGLEAEASPAVTAAPANPASRDDRAPPEVKPISDAGIDAGRKDAAPKSTFKVGDVPAAFPDATLGGPVEGVDGGGLTKAMAPEAGAEAMRAASGATTAAKQMAALRSLEKELREDEARQTLKVYLDAVKQEQAVRAQEETQQRRMRRKADRELRKSKASAGVGVTAGAVFDVLVESLGDMTDDELNKLLKDLSKQNDNYTIEPPPVY